MYKFDVECPEMLKYDNDFLVEIFKKNVYYFLTECSMEFLCRKDLLDALKPYLIDFFKKNINLFNHWCPKHIKIDDDVLQVLKPYFVKYFKKEEKETSTLNRPGL